MFGSLDSLSAKVPKGPRGKSNILQSSSISTEVLKRAFSTEFQVASKTSKMSGVQEVEPPRTRQLAQSLNAEEMMKMDFYSKFTPTSVTLSHFLDHSSGGGTVEDSFLFLRREIPVRLANIMMELEVNIDWPLFSQAFLKFLFLNFSCCQTSFMHKSHVKRS